MSGSVVVVRTGSANIASVLAAFRRLGVAPSIADEAEQIEQADRVVLPGVGSFGAAMGVLDHSGMRSALCERVSRGRPTLAICVGMQLLAGGSEESVGAAGLGCVPSEVRRFSDDVRVPQLGWNEVRPGVGLRFVTDGWAYFANSYRIESAPEGWNAATTDHGGVFVSAMECGDVLACQFHPELSGQWGAGVLGSWLGATRRAV